MDKHDEQNTAKAHEQLWDIIKDIKFAMLTTRHGNGHLHSRPVTTQNKSLDEGDSLWFFLSASGDPVADLTEEPSVNLAYASPDDDRYVSVSGKAAVVDDMNKKRELWNKMAEAWFPRGVDDPDLALVQVQITHAEYWDVKDSKLTQMFKMAKAAVTGHPPRDMGETGQVRMH